MHFLVDRSTSDLPQSSHEGDGRHRMTEVRSTLRSWLRRAAEVSRWIAEPESLPPPPARAAPPPTRWMQNLMASDTWPTTPSGPRSETRLGWVSWLFDSDTLPETAATSDGPGRGSDRQSDQGAMRWLLASEELPDVPTDGEPESRRQGLMSWLFATEELPGFGERSREEGRQRGD